MPSRNPVKPSRKLLALMLVASIAFMTGLRPLDADAKKKKDAVDPQAEEKLKEGLEPLSKTLSEMLVKIQARGLFSPDDSGKLEEIRFQLLDMMNQHPKNPLVIQPVYQAGVVYQKRERYLDAYELFSFLSMNFPENPYGLRAQNEIRVMKQKLGEAYFPAQPESESAQESPKKK